MRTVAGFCAAALVALLVGPPAAARDGGVAILQGLDKVTARISTIRAPIAKPVRFGTLVITARTCEKAPPEEPPEVAVFLEIVDLRRDGAPQDAFRGWMFASSPAVSAMEHPVYDVWAVDCVSASISPGGAPAGSE